MFFFENTKKKTHKFQRLNRIVAEMMRGRQDDDTSLEGWRLWCVKRR